mgnify:FL=1
MSSEYKCIPSHRGRCGSHRHCVVIGGLSCDYIREQSYVCLYGFDCFLNEMLAYIGVGFVLSVLFIQGNAKALKRGTMTIELPFP